ncbi:hypothetical protein BHC44_08530 [Snodgrassella alvi]|nr:hypothetical protein BHC44_08530 [Snodgrassella alvi]
MWFNNFGHQAEISTVLPNDRKFDYQHQHNGLLIISFPFCHFLPKKKRIYTRIRFDTELFLMSRWRNQL